MADSDCGGGHQRDVLFPFTNGSVPRPVGSDSSLTSLPQVTTLRGVTGSKPTSEKAEMHWADADTLELSIALNGSETALSTVEIPGTHLLTLSPVTLPYSPEFKPVEADEGQTALARLASTTGGKERLDLTGVWKDLPRQPRLIELAPWLLLTAIGLLLIEVLERHTGLVTAQALPLFSKLPALKLKRKAKVSQPMISPPTSALANATPPETVEPPKPETQQPEPAQIFDALQQARQKAKERTQR